MSSRRPNNITRSSSQGDQLGRRPNGGWNRRRSAALLRRAMAPLLAPKNPPNNGDNIIDDNAAASFPIEREPTGERRREFGRDHGQEQPCSPRCAFELAAPPRGVDDWISRRKTNPGEEGFGAFLRICVFCKKKLAKCHIYMYGYLGAFCSPECRDYQIALDGFDEQFEAEFEKILSLWENRTIVLAPRRINLN